MASGFFQKIFQPEHAACGCRPHISMCGTYNPDMVDVASSDLPVEQEDVEKWCQQCLAVWMAMGCGNCGCGPYNLCSICEAAVQSTAD